MAQIDTPFVVRRLDAWRRAEGVRMRCADCGAHTMVRPGSTAFFPRCTTCSSAELTQVAASPADSG